MIQDDKQGSGWERQIIENLAMEAVREKRRARRWGIFFKFLLLIYLVMILALTVPDEWSDTAIGNKEHTALVDIEGVIAPGEPAGADSVVQGLRDAFEDKKTKGVILRINSPGGSPVQSSYINSEIRRLREKYPEIPLYAVVSDICASGGYYIAASADKIYVNESSIVGSIGVLINSFGFVDGMEKLGIERRLMTAGEHKGVLDPFSPVSEYERQHVQRVLDQLHQQFIDAVKVGRGERLKSNDDLFSGLFWSGRESVELGLADDFASAGQVARDVIGVEEIVDFTVEQDPLERLAERLGAGAAKMLAEISGLSAKPRM